LSKQNFIQMKMIHKKSQIIFLLTGVLLFIFPFGKTINAQGCETDTPTEGIKIMGYIQPQFNTYFFGTDASGNPIKNSTFFFKRARLGVMGAIPYDISYYVMVEMSPVAGGPQLLDAYITYAPFGKKAMFSIGQFKSPYSLELNTPCFALHTIRRSTVVNQLASPFRDMGLMVLGKLGKNDFLKYRIALLNGTGINHLDINQNKDLAFSIHISPLKWITVGGSYRGGLIGNKQLNGDQEKFSRYAVDFTLKRSNLLFQGEYLWGTDVGTVISGGGCGGKKAAEIIMNPVELMTLASHNKNGYWALAQYTTPWNLQAVVKYQYYNSGNTTYTYLGQAQAFPESTMTLGFNYFINDWTRIQVNYLYNAEQKANGIVNEYKNDALLIQVQVKF